MDIKQRIVDLWQLGYNNREVANIINTEAKTDYWDSERIRDRIRKHIKKQNRIQADKVINNIVNDNSNYTIKTIKRNKILILSDLHIPFYREELFDIVEKYKDEVKAIVFPGDILDCFEISKFSSINNYPIENELIDAITVFKKIRKLVGIDVDLILLYGNHDARWRKYIANMHQKKLYKFINPNILDMLKSGFTLYENGKETKYEGVADLKVINSWYVNINNELICCHPNNFSRVEIKNAKMAIEHFISRGEIFSTLAVAHNHHQAETPRFLGKYAIETGCMCQQFEYSDGYTSTRPQDNGYVLISFDKDGKVNKNDSKVFTLNYASQIDENVQIEVKF
jgi:predicted phosphodiesterase